MAHVCTMWLFCFDCGLIRNQNTSNPCDTTIHIMLFFLRRADVEVRSHTHTYTHTPYIPCACMSIFSISAPTKHHRNTEWKSSKKMTTTKRNMIENWLVRRLVCSFVRSCLPYRKFHAQVRTYSNNFTYTHSLPLLLCVRMSPAKVPYIPFSFEHCEKSVESASHSIPMLSSVRLQPSIRYHVNIVTRFISSSFEIPFSFHWNQRTSALPTCVLCARIRSENKTVFLLFTLLALLCNSIGIIIHTHIHAYQVAVSCNSYNILYRKCCAVLLRAV